MLVTLPANSKGDNMSLNKIRKNKKAFTLLELIVVLVILGILAALAIPSFNRVQQNSAAQVASSTAKSLVRDANALAAQNQGASAGITYAANIYTAYTELTVPSNLTASWSAAGSSVTLQVNGGGQGQVCYVGLGTNSPIQAVAQGVTLSGTTC